MTGPTILYYDPNPLADLSRLRRAAGELGSALRVVSPAETGQPLGFLAGLPDCPPRPGAPSGPLPEPVMVFCLFLPDRFDAALELLRREGLSVSLKAVLTQTNRTWPLERLARALRAERQALGGS